MNEKRFKLGDSLVHYPVRSVIEAYPNYILKIMVNKLHYQKSHKY